ncbi:MAG: AraC family transcriptional activator of pyochelin receptor [Bacteroidia bacterium]|jgi:AraC family transcriptional activator of pyochelin receptor
MITLLKSAQRELYIFPAVAEPLNHLVELSSSLVHFFFCTKGIVNFQFSAHYQKELTQGNYFTIYDQERSLKADLHSADCALVYVAIPPKTIHELFIDDTKNLVHFNFSGFGVREYAVKPINIESDALLDNIYLQTTPTSLKSVYYNAKITELMGYLFDVPNESLYEACPFLKEQDNVEKIKNARNIMIEHLDNPPTLKDLAKKIGMNEYNLKIGFKNVYGLPVFKYVQEYKLNLAKRHLREGSLQVAEIADKIGYKSSSHFIDAFKKKFGITPKKFMQEVG